MKTIQKTIKIDEIFPTTRSQAIIEGKLTPPSLSPEMASIMFVDGKTSIDTSEVSEGKITIEGTSLVTVVYIGIDDKVYSFDSKTNFSHSVLIDGADKGMTCTVKSSVKDIDYTMIDIGAVSVKCIVEIACKLYLTKTKSYISDALKEDVMVKQKKQSFWHLTKQAKDMLD
jgi:hypothetical protein